MVNAYFVELTMKTSILPVDYGRKRRPVKNNTSIPVC